MAPRNLSHVAIGVRDMDTSIAFYRDVVGLEVTFDDTEEFHDAAGAVMLRRRGVYLRWASERDDPDAAFLVLDQPYERERRGAPTPMGELGVHHFGFWVDDVDAVAERARTAGAEFFLGPAAADSKEYGEPAGKPMRMLLLHDPDGNVIQFDQRV